MININSYFTKQFLNKEANKDTLMLELEGVKPEVDNKQRLPLNVSLVIDISGSMDQPINIDNKHESSLQQLMRTTTVNEHQKTKTKLHYAKEMAKQFVRNTHSDDRVSIVVFGGDSKVVFESTKMNQNNQEKVLSVIDSLRTSGMTALHDGWLKGVKQVTNSISEKALNRVILLSDGQANVGETNKHTIKQHASNMGEASISTTTFGVGNDFNEDLLQAMAYASGGNAYYLESERDFKVMASQEIKGINNVVGFDVRLSLNLTKSFAIDESYHDFETNEQGELIIPNIYAQRKIPLVFDMKYNANKKAKSMKVGEFVLTYKDKEGHEQVVTSPLKMELVNEAQWQELKSNKEVVAQKALMEIAKRKDLARDNMDQGNFERAHSLLNALNESDIFTGVKDSRVEKEREKIKTMIQSGVMNQQNYACTRKTLSYGSYNTKMGMDFD